MDPSNMVTAMMMFDDVSSSSGDIYTFSAIIWTGWFFCVGWMMVLKFDQFKCKYNTKRKESPLLTDPDWLALVERIKEHCVAGEKEIHITTDEFESYLRGTMRLDTDRENPYYFGVRLVREE